MTATEGHAQDDAASDGDVNGMRREQIPDKHILFKVRNSRDVRRIFDESKRSTSLPTLRARPRGRGCNWQSLAYVGSPS
ncbi:hypothetical protein HDU97_002157 [Phlyctochytrium planicorne]|nr:hypothetical protein HDU97_002157 [Phlyctochytrium planicorne]